MSTASSLDPQAPSSTSSSRRVRRHPDALCRPRLNAALAYRTLATQPKLRRKRAIELYTHGKVSEVEFDAITADVEQELKDPR